MDLSDEEVEKLGKLMKKVLSPERWKILQSLSHEPTYTRDLARRLDINEQNAYFHVRQLAKEGLIAPIHQENIRGGRATIWSVPFQTWRVTFGSLNDSPSILSSSPLRDFIAGNKFLGRLVCGAPEPHGPFRATARDSHLVAELAWFLGTNLEFPANPVIYTDIEVNVRGLWNSNLIVIGGPITNNITSEINETTLTQTLNLRFTTFKNIWGLETPNGTKYVEPEIGIIALVPNPKNEKFKCLVLAGVGVSGTRTVIRALCEEKITLPLESEFFGWVVQGIDHHGNGIMLFDEILEKIPPVVVHSTG